ncbi:DUF4184 family protein [Telluribacter sp. SYSU D00476]|uniref:DUF4184 family protein n=1 Tax=Telluribacter sp. SYSU D00476 TaxID=2811430 RepID=UPI001FF1759D|nr:DUF4184 family protein [Telluribacter sp. SYSU D00476]
MPFTLSHPAIVLPLQKWKPAWFSVTGLVFGSMAPDFEYFMSFSGNYDFGHSFLGIFLFDLPMTFGLAALYHLLIRNPLLSHLPSPFDKRFSGFMGFNFYMYLRKHWLAFIASSLIGIASHFIWDKLGYPDGYLGIYHLAPQFFEQTYTALGGEQPMYALLEHIGSAIALVALIWVLLKINEPADTYIPPTTISKVAYWFILSVGTTLIFMREQNTNPHEWFDSIPHRLVVGLSAGTVTIIGVSLLFQLLAYRRRTS